MVLPTALKIVIALALLFCAFVDFLFFIGGGAGGSKAMATAGLLVGGVGMLACGYSLYLLTLGSLLWWQVGIVALACLPLLGILFNSVVR